MSGAARIAAREASTAIEVLSSSYEATDRVPEPADGPSDSPIALRSRRK